MLKTIQTFAIVAAFAAPTFVLAQDQAPATDEQAPATTEEQTTSEAPSDLATGQPVEPQVTSEAFGDWTVNCQQLGEQERCQMYQLLRDSQNNPVVEVNLFKVEGQPQVFAGGTVIAPLETLLTPQLTISIDGALGKRYPFAFCMQNGCVSRIGLTEDDVNSYKRGNEASVTIVPVQAPDQTVTVKMSLTGFTAAFDRLP